MKDLKGWLIVNEVGLPDCYDYRIPVFWLKSVAEEECKKWAEDESTVVAVIIKARKP